MDLIFLSESFDFIGKVMVLVFALIVHNLVRKEGKIDIQVIRKMNKEKIGAYVGLTFLVVAYALQLYVKYR